MQQRKRQLLHRQSIRGSAPPSTHSPGRTQRTPRDTCRWREQRGTHADSSEFQRAGKTGEDSGAWQQREKRKRKGNGSWAGRFELGSAELNVKTNGVSAN